MIYSDLFDALPAPIRERVYQRLCDVLSGRDKSSTYASMTAEERTAILEIVRDTKHNLPTFWGIEQAG